MSARTEADTLAQAVIDSLLDEPPDEKERKVALEDIDVVAFATRLRRQVDAHFASERHDVYKAAEKRRLAELPQMQTDPLLLDLPREHLVTRLSGLVRTAGPEAAVDFMNFEKAPKQELAEMIRSLEHLIEGESE
ncbi:MAG: hypothetical protein ACPGVG_08590 [Mycobacterium sp.]